MNTKQTVKNVLGALVAAAAATTLQAQAGSYSETLVTTQAVPTATVSYADLDLSTDKGQQSLHYRLNAAARQVCGSTDYRITGSPGVAAANRDCQKRALEDAMSQVNADRVAVVVK